MGPVIRAFSTSGHGTGVKTNALFSLQYAPVLSRWVRPSRSSSRLSCTLPNTPLSDIRCLWISESDSPLVIFKTGHFIQVWPERAKILLLTLYWKWLMTSLLGNPKGPDGGWQGISIRVYQSGGRFLHSPCLAYSTFGTISRILSPSIPTYLIILQIPLSAGTTRM